MTTTSRTTMATRSTTASKSSCCRRSTRSSKTSSCRHAGRSWSRRGRSPHRRAPCSARLSRPRSSPWPPWWRALCSGGARRSDRRAPGVANAAWTRCSTPWACRGTSCGRSWNSCLHSSPRRRSASARRRLGGGWCRAARPRRSAPTRRRGATRLLWPWARSPSSAHCGGGCGRGAPARARIGSRRRSPRPPE